MTGAGGAVTATGGEHTADGEGEGDQEVAQTEGELTLVLVGARRRRG